MRCTLQLDFTDDKTGYSLFKVLNIVDEAHLWWDPTAPESAQGKLLDSCLILNEELFKELSEHPSSLDLRAIRVFRNSSLSLDIYTWITHRLYYLEKPTTIPWRNPQMQLGSNYAMTNQDTRSFKHKFVKHLTRVTTVYPKARIAVTNHGLTLRPSPAHMKHKKQGL